MTQREFYTAITQVEAVPAELREFAQTAIKKLDARNEARKGKETPKQKAAAEKRDEILKTMDVGRDYTAKEIGELVGISQATAVAQLRKLAEAGDVEVSKPKSSKPQIYRLATTTIKVEVVDEGF
jgi:Fic family protein